MRLLDHSLIDGRVLFGTRERQTELTIMNIDSFVPEHILQILKICAFE